MYGLIKSKRIPHREVKRGITRPVGVYQRPSLLVARRIVRFYTKVETQQEICEIEPQPKPVSDSYLFIEFIQLECTARLAFIFLDCPYITGIDKQPQFKHPEQFSPIFDIQVKTNIATLVYKAIYRIGGIETTGTECTHTPPAHRIGSAGIKSFFKRLHRGIAVGYCSTGAQMECK